MSENDAFYRGQNVTFKIYQQFRPIYIAGKNWEVNQNSTEIADDVNGEKRSRLDIITNFYDASVDIFQSDQEVMDALIAAQQTADDAGLPLKQTASLLIEHRNGTKAAYMMLGCCFGPWKTNGSNRTDAVMLNLKMRFTKWKKV